MPPLDCYFDLPESAAFLRSPSGDERASLFAGGEHPR